MEVEVMRPYMNGQRYLYRIFGGDGERRIIRIHDWATLCPVDVISCGPAGDGNIYEIIWDAVIKHLKKITREIGFSEFEVLNPENKWVRFEVKK